MKLPSLNQQPVNQAQNYHGFAEGNGLEPAFIGGLFDIGKTLVGGTACVLQKAGPKGVECFAKCGPNLGCLASCAGPTLARSVLSCITG